MTATPTPGYVALDERPHGGHAKLLALVPDGAHVDVGCCGDLIEHLRDPQRFLERVRPLLRDGGRLVLTTPNVANWTIRLGLVFGRWRYTQRGILDRTHTHPFTRKTLVEALGAAGYRVSDLDFTVAVPLVGTRAVEGLAHSVARVRPSLFADQFVVAATPS